MSSKLYYYYGAMNSGKSASLLLNVHNYEDQGKDILILKPKSSTREEKGKIVSRIGLSHEALEFNDNDDLYNIIVRYMNESCVDLDCIFVDEVNFATRKQIKELVDVVDKLNISVITFGLKNSYIDGELFESVKELLYQANSVMEIKATCNYCNSKATHHLRVANGNIIRSGEQNIVGDIKDNDEKYISVCRKHYYNPSK